MGRCRLWSLALGLAVCAAGVAAGAERAGPGRRMIGFRADTTGFFPRDARPPTDFDGPTGRNLVWKVPLPNFSNSSPIVVGRKVFVMCDHGWPPVEGDVPRLLCFDADDGGLLWERAIDPLDTLSEAQAAPLRAARRAFWTRQHAVCRLHYRFHFEAEAPEQREALRKEASQHAPRLRHNDPVRKYFVEDHPGPRMHWYAAMNHPDCEPLRGRRGQVPAPLGVSSWNWTGVGMAMTTPISDGEAVYVLTGLRTVTKFDLEGNMLWHVWEKDTKPTKFYECWLANALRILPVTLDGKARRLLVMDYLEHLWAYDCDTGELVWMTPTSGHGGHVCGTPQLLRLPRAGGGEELLVVTRSGHVIRARDGKALAEHLFNVNYAGPIGDGRERLWIRQVGGDGGHFHPREESPAEFRKKCLAGLRFRRDGETLAFDTFFYDEKGLRRPMAQWLGFYRDGELITKTLDRIDAETGETIREGPRGYGAYHGSILAGGHFYGVPKMRPPAGAPRGTRPGRQPDVDARMVCHVAKDGDPITFVGERTIEIIEADPKDPDERDQRIALTGRLYPGEWYCWHGAYTAPFASGNRLFIRTFDNLYCFGDPGKPFVPSKAFEP